MLGGRGTDSAYHPQATTLINERYYDFWSNRLNDVFDNRSSWRYPGSGSTGSWSISIGSDDSVFGSGRRPPY